MRTVLLPAVIAAACVATLATPAAAQRRAPSTRFPSRELEAGLDSAAHSLASSEYFSVGSTWGDTPDSIETWESRFPFRADSQYVVVGICDRPCTSLGIRVLKPDGTQLASSPHPGRTTSVAFTASANGRLSFVLRMTGSSLGGSYRYGLKVLSK